MISKTFIKISQKKLLTIKKVLVVFKPVSGVGISGHANETKYPVLSFYGTKSSSVSDVKILNVNLKDYAKLGYLVASTDYRTTVIPPGNETGKITSVIKEVSFEDYNYIYYTINANNGNEILLKDLITVMLLTNPGKTL